MSNTALTWARRVKLGSTTRKAVLYVLADRASDKDGTLYAGQETIAAEADASVRTVSRVLCELEEWGVIARQERRRHDGYRTSDLIRVNIGWQPSPVTESPDTQSHDSESPDTVAASDDQAVSGNEAEPEPHATQSHLTIVQTSPDKCDTEPGSHQTQCQGKPQDIYNPQEEPSVARPTNPEAERLCQMLADSIAERVPKRPKVTKAWLTDMDRMLRLDKRPPERVEGAIRWLNSGTKQADFWAKNILSPKKLRQQFDRLYADAKYERKWSGNGHAQQSWQDSQAIRDATADGTLNPNANPMDGVAPIGGRR